jgi:hypothetical protein
MLSCTAMGHAQPLRAQVSSALQFMNGLLTRTSEQIAKKQTTRQVSANGE